MPDQIKILLAVSPVALMTTYESRHVLTSTVCSKSILRVAADEGERRFEKVIYFPSYEIITSPSAEGRYDADDLRQVNQLGVDHVMRVFKHHFSDNSDWQSRKPDSTPTDVFSDTPIVCDEEEMKHAFGTGSNARG